LTDDGQPCFLLDVPGGLFAAGKFSGIGIKGFLPEADECFKRFAVA
jgi:hypothetical protein